jgi:reverse gyrase
MLAIEPEERDCFAGLIFPLATKKIDDIALSTLMSIANFSAEESMEKIREIVGEDIADQPFREVLNKFVSKASAGGYSNYGTLRPVNLTEEQEEKIWTSPPPPREIKDT